MANAIKEKTPNLLDSQEHIDESRKVGRVSRNKVKEIIRQNQKTHRTVP